MKIKRFLTLILPLLAFPMLQDAQAGSSYCREFTKTVMIGNTPQESYGTACMQPDGSWEIQSQQPVPGSITLQKQVVVTPTTTHIIQQDHPHYRPMPTRPLYFSLSFPFFDYDDRYYHGHKYKKHHYNQHDRHHRHHYSKHKYKQHHDKWHYSRHHRGDYHHRGHGHHKNHVHKKLHAHAWD